MKIEGNKKIGANKPKEKELKSSSTKKEELKEVEQSSLNAMANYGQAQVSMSFKGEKNNADSHTSGPTPAPTTLPDCEPTMETETLPDCEPTTEPAMEPEIELTTIPTCEPAMEPEMEPLPPQFYTPQTRPTTSPTMNFFQSERYESKPKSIVDQKLRSIEHFLIFSDKLSSEDVYKKNGLSSDIKGILSYRDTLKDKLDILDFIDDLCRNEEIERNDLTTWSSILKSIKRHLGACKNENEKTDYINWVKELYSNKDLPKIEMGNILFRTYPRNIDLAKKLYDDETLPNEYISSILFSSYSKNLSQESIDKQIAFAHNLINDESFPKEYIKGILSDLDTYNQDFALQLYSDPNFPKEEIENILINTSKETIDFAKELYDNPKVPQDSIADIIAVTMEDNIETIRDLIEDEKFPTNEIGNFFYFTKGKNIKCAKQLCYNPQFPLKYLIPCCIEYDPKTDEDIAEISNFAMEIDKDDNIEEQKKINILERTTTENIELAKRLYHLPDFPSEIIAAAIENNHPKNQQDIDKIINFYQELLKNKEIPQEEARKILCETKIHNVDVVKRLIKEQVYSPSDISDIASLMKEFKVEFTEKLCFNKSHSAEDITKILSETYEDNFEIANKLCDDKSFSSEEISRILSETYGDNIEIANKLCDDKTISHSKIPAILKFGIEYKAIKNLQNVFGVDVVNKIPDKDIDTIAKLYMLYNIRNINEISLSDKKEAVRNLVACNTNTFEISDEFKRDFPLIPKSKEEYCTLLATLVKSLGIETNELTNKQIADFNTSLTNLSNSLISLDDNEYANLSISQEYSKDEFINDVLSTIKNLPEKERQKVYDYFGFELHHNENTKAGFSITGYPVNLNNGKKLAKIEDEKTKAVVEELRPFVIKFSQDNRIKCSNPDIEKDLNSVADAFPEIRTMIEKSQHGTQDFDVFKHSLKVMQKVCQDENFAKLNDSDKKIILLASLFHDITKKEATIDKTHQSESAFDTFYITKKLGLSREEEIKLNTLIGQHEWLAYANTAKNEIDRKKRLQNIAYDLHQDNLFDMALMFTHADLKAVKVDNSFHDTEYGNSRIDFNGERMSHGKRTDIFAEKIRENIAELKKSQPLLPTTKFPKASTIDKAITKVNSDGSTNIKGVYKIDGNTVIKFNEVEDFEAIGFPKGSTNKGYMSADGERETGNIKFFVHGLDYANQLNKFDVFSLPDSDALLSVSYAEAVETKNRFFRTQGVILDTDTKYIHGGGKTDSGSGHRKTIEDFKNKYIFGGNRQGDRDFVSNLIKEATGMNDEEYINFVEVNKNKQMSEIEPKEVQEKIIKAFATINSTTRRGNREYNEMYISNPRIMGVFAYPTNTDNIVGNMNTFMQNQPDFLKDYAKDNDLPFVVFGN